MQFKSSHSHQAFRWNALHIDDFFYQPYVPMGRIYATFVPSGRMVGRNAEKFFLRSVRNVWCRSADLNCAFYDRNCFYLSYMKNVSILVPESSVMQAIADPQYLFSIANQFLTASGKAPLFHVELVGVKKDVKL